MSFKDYFQKKTFKPSSANSLTSSVESPLFLSQKVDNLARFMPSVDFSDPANFAFFGSAEKYYNDSFKRIYTTYPYDGTFLEKEQWQASSSYIDLFIFENKYPRTNGHVKCSPAGWGSKTATFATNYGKPNTLEYISFLGGPNVKNVYDPSNKQESNLKISGIDGNTVEFWLKKSGIVAGALTQREVVFDAFTVGELDPVLLVTEDSKSRLVLQTRGSPFYITYRSSSVGPNISTNWRFNSYKCDSLRWCMAPLCIYN